MLIGAIFAFWIAQLMVITVHGFSFTSAFNMDSFFVIRAFFWLAILLLAYFVLCIIRGYQIHLIIGRYEIAFFILGIIILMAIAIWIKFSVEPGFRRLPYIVIPRLFLIALASFWVLVGLHFRPNESSYWSSGTQCAPRK